MALHARTRRIILLLAVGLAAGLAFFAVNMMTSPRSVGEAIIMFVGALLFGFLIVFFPYGFIALGLWKLRDQRRREIAALGDDNTVTADPDGPRKLHEYLTAITSTEARIGLLQRSEPWPGDKPQS